MACVSLSMTSPKASRVRINSKQNIDNNFSGQLLRLSALSPCSHQQRFRRKFVLSIPCKQVLMVLRVFSRLISPRPFARKWFSFSQSYTCKQAFIVLRVFSRLVTPGRFAHKWSPLHSTFKGAVHRLDRCNVPAGIQVYVLADTACYINN